MILADLGADVIRVERPGGQLLSGGRDHAAQPRPTQRRARPQAAGGRGHGARAGEGRRPPGGGDATGRRRAARDRSRAVPCGQPPPGVRADDRLGPGRPAGPGGRSRHQLHLGRGRAVQHGPDARAAAVPGQHRGRLRRRVDVPGHRAARCAARRQGVGRGTGGGRRDRRRHRTPQRDDVVVPGQRRLPGGTRRQPPRRWRAVLRRLRDLRRQARVGRGAGAAVLRHPAAHPRARGDRARAGGPGPVRRAPNPADRHLQAAHPGRVGRALRRHRRLRRRRHPDQ